MTPQKRKLIVEGVLVVVLFVLVAVSFTVAWFTEDGETNVNEFQIEVKSSDSFQLSLDGVNFDNSITINLDNKSIQIGDETIDSSVQLSDLASVLTTISNEQGTATYKQLGIYNPTRDEDTGEPIISLDGEPAWKEAIKSKVIKSGDKYYLTSSDVSTLAQYLELDIWVRSDSNLSIYLGEESTIYPVTEVGEAADYLPAMASTTITEYGYVKNMYFDNVESKFYAATYNDENFTYLYKYNNDDENTLTFLLKTKIQQLENKNTHVLENFTYYYSGFDQYIVRSKPESISLLIAGTTTPLGECEAFYGSSDNPLFYVKSEYDNGYYNKVVYNSMREVVDQENYNTFFESYGGNFIEYLNTYNLNSFNFRETTETKTPLTNTYYYDELGKVLIRIENNNGSIKYYDDTNTLISSPEKPYKVLKESYYGTEDLEKIDDIFITKSTKYTFSKNLAAGAALVAFSEISTDDFSEGNKVVNKEVENLKVLWNPLPKFNLVTQGTTSKYVYDESREEELKYYTYNENDNTYSLNTWNDDSLIKVGNFNTSSLSIGSGEEPICETKVVSGDKYAIKKLRIKIWLDGNDPMAIDSMLNSSAVGNGQIKMSISLVANINATTLTYEPYIQDVGGVEQIVPGKFLVTASKSNNIDTGYTFSVTGTWTTSFGDTAAIANIQPKEGTTNQAIVEFYKYGSVTVYARANDGRVGSILINNDYVKFIKLYDESKPNEYRIIAVNMYCNKSVDELTADDLVLDGTWDISDKNIATTIVNPDGSLTVKFSSAGEEIISYSCMKQDTLNYIDYYAGNNIKINHSYIVEGGE